MNNNGLWLVLIFSYFYTLSINSSISSKEYNQIIQSNANMVDFVSKFWSIGKHKNIQKID